MQVTIRRLALAALAGLTLAMAADLLLQLALEAVRTAGPGTAITRVIARSLDRAAWPVAAGLLWFAAPRLAGQFERVEWSDGRTRHLTHAAAARAVGTTLIAAPILWVLATWIVWITTGGLTDSWSSLGRVFVSGSYYSSMLGTYAPWVLSGAALVAWSRHLPVSP